MKEQSGGNSEYWVLIVDEVYKMAWSLFIKKKSDLPEAMRTLIKTLLDREVNLKFLCCDNAGGNKIFEKTCIEENFKITFEFTPLDTPPHNGVVEREYQTLYDRVRATLASSGLIDPLKSIIWAECSSTVMFLHNITIKSGRNKCPYEIFWCKRSPSIHKLRSFGEMGVVKTVYSPIKRKLQDRGQTMMFVGYIPHHSSELYRMCNFLTNKIVTTRYIVWLDKLYKDWENNSTEDYMPIAKRTRHNLECPDHLYHTPPDDDLNTFEIELNDFEGTVNIPIDVNNVVEPTQNVTTQRQTPSVVNRNTDVTELNILRHR